MDYQPPQNPHADRYPKKVRYFIPGQVILHLEHPPNQGPAEIAGKLRGYFLEMAGWNKLHPPKAESILTFPILNKAEKWISIVPAFLKDQQLGEDENEKDTVSAIRDLNNILKEQGGTISIADITLRSVAPNWLMSGANHQIGSGGPGGLPSPVLPDLDFLPSFTFQNLPAPLQGIEGGNGVHIAILDTAPCLEDLFQAYLKWQATHPLIQTLLVPGGPLHVYPASRDDFYLLVDYSIGMHRYLMPDHGLFVAGIVHTIAPRATLHLYEVLNPYGIGCVETIAKGLYQAITNPAILDPSGQPSPLIINCSLVLNVPRQGTSPNAGVGPSLEETDPDFPFDPGEIEILCASFRELVNLISGQEKILLVAAAGNDATTPERRPAARYPAAYEPVIGVGALPREAPSPEPPKGPGSRKIFQKSHYSNRSDDPAAIGFATLGGEQGEEQGILGVYIGKFPRYRGRKPVRKNSVPLRRVRYFPNKNGWAWWAGTSFATPVLSGILGLWWSANPAIPANRAWDFLETLNNPTGNPGDEAVADNGERAILVEQKITP